MTRRSLLLIVAVLLLAAAGGVLWLLQPDRAGTSSAPARTAATEPESPALPQPAGGASAPESLGAAPAHPVQAIESPGGAPAVIEGRVIDRGGSAIAGATLQVLLLTGNAPFRTREDAGLTGTSAGDGRFHLVGAPAGEALALEVAHDDFAPSLREPFTGAPGHTTDLGDIVLEDGLALTGTVSGAAGEPLAGASVKLSDVATLSATGAVSKPLRTVTTDERGGYALPHLALRQYAVEAEAEGHLRATTVLSLVLGAPAGSWRQDFQLLPADSRLFGRVLDPDERPVAGATLRLSQRQQRANTYFLENSSTDNDGNYLFDDLAQGHYQLELNCAAFYLPQPVDLPAGPESQVVHVQRALSVHGQLQADGELPLNFLVGVRPDGRTGAGLVSGEPVEREIKGSDPRGSFVVDGLRPGTYRFAVSAPGFAETTSQDVVLGPGSGRTDVLIPLTRGGAIAGHLSEPLAGVRIELRGDDYDPALSIESTFPTPPLPGLVVKTDDQGAFRVEHVPEGAYTLSARPAAAPPLHVRSVQVGEGATTDVGTLALLRGGVVFGNVLGADGRPRQGVRIAAQGPAHQQQALSDAQGGFRLEALPPGDYELTASPGNLWEALRFEARQTVSVKAGEERPVLLTLTERQPVPPR